MLMENLTSLINRLISYGLCRGLIKQSDSVYVRNRLFDLFKLDAPENLCDENCFVQTEEDELSFEEIIEGLLDFAAERNLLEENSVTFRDLFDAKIMDILIDRPSNIIEDFNEKYKISASVATDYFYKLSCDSNYIKRYRIKKDLKWMTPTEYGDLDITVNLSKPEKDPKAIAAAKLVKTTGYPKCLLCPENEGYAGRVNHPARNNHRIIPLKLGNQQWYLQYSPYVYYNEHCIVFNKNHSPMVIDRGTFEKLFDFVKMFPHYLIGSNADLPIVGGSILTHEHFQGGRYIFPLNKAPALESFKIHGFEDISCEIVKWPMSVIRLSGKDSDKMIALADKILQKWRHYSDEECFIFAQTEDGECHNTITPILHKQDDYFILDLVLRNNITTAEHPLGVFHPHAKLHHIKKENIGLIEVMGLAVLPSRLKNEMELLKEYILNGKDIASNELISSHKDWVNEFLPEYEKTGGITKDNIDSILQTEIGRVFLEVLKDAGVYKMTEKGLAGFSRFVAALQE